ncbi:MAG: D-alanine--D-alanine ligase [Phycisphaerales bacterium]|nr:MAG: D-alanine--D-alanine ligase [Phycisphaerales bacterium]
MKVAVLRGGIGQEREVSLESGRCVARGLREGGLEVLESDIRPDDLTVLDRSDIDVFFIALHGEFGEDGQLQQILEDRGLIYTGCGPEASRLAFDKVASKERFAAAGVSIAPTVECGSGTDGTEIEGRLRGLGDRFVVKPIRQGSSVGVYVVNSTAEAVATAQQAYAEFGDCMIEPFLRGQEITVGVLGRETLPIIEIRSKTGFYDYQAKYLDEQTEYLFDTVRGGDVRRQIGQAALACYDALWCRDFARVDFILTEEGTAYALEINTIPGFTTHSLLPKAAARVGISMSALCVRIVRASFSRKSSVAKR